MVFIHLIQSKLDEKTSVAWDNKREFNARPTLAEFTNFLDRRARSLRNAYHSEAATTVMNHNERKRSSNHHKHQSDTKRFKPNSSNSSHTAVKSEKQVACAVCPEEHPTRKCPVFAKLNLAARKDKVRQENLCYNCLGKNHAVRDCESGKCTRCDKKHNTLLCSKEPKNRGVFTGQKFHSKKRTYKSIKKQQQQ